MFDVFDDINTVEDEDDQDEVPTGDDFAPDQAILDGLDVPVVPDTQVDISQDVQEVKGEQQRARSALWKVCSSIRIFNVGK